MRRALIAVAIAAAAIGLGVSVGLSQELDAGPAKADVLPCPIPCPGDKYEALVDEATGEIVAVSGYTPTDPEEGRLFVDKGQTVVDVTSLDVADLMANLETYTIDLSSLQAMKSGKPVGSVELSS